MLPLVASAYNVYDVKIDGIYYSLRGNEAQVTYRSIEEYYDDYGNYYDYCYSDYSGDVVIPESITYDNKTYSVTSIGDNAFRDCSGLTSVTIPNSVTSIGIDAFWLTGWYNAQPDGILYLDNWLIGYKGTKPTGNVTINSGTRGIADQAFYWCSGLTSITIPNSVTSIGEYAFEGCGRLTSVTIGEGVTSIGDYAFYKCSSLTSIDIPNSVTSIGSNAFAYCSGLTSITIGEGVTSIGHGAFSKCRSLTSVTIGDGVTSIGHGAFNETAWLSSQPDGLVYAGKVAYKYKGSMPQGTNIILEEGTLGIAGGAFYDCSGLTSIIIPNSVTSIGSQAFYGCSGLTSVSIGSGVTNIGDEAFKSCRSLKEVYCYAENVPSTAWNPFEDSNIRYATLHVPAASVAAYKSNQPWNQFKSIEAIEYEKCATPTISYVNGKLTFNCDTEDVVFHSTISDTDVASYLTQEVELGVTYTISVYATRIFYNDSDIAIGTLCWIDQQPNTEGIIAEDAITEVKALPVLIQSNGGTITVQGANEGTEIMVYSVNGMKQGSAIATKGFASINTSLQPGSTAIVKIGEKSIKVLIK